MGEVVALPGARPRERVTPTELLHVLRAADPELATVLDVEGRQVGLAGGLAAGRLGRVAGAAARGLGGVCGREGEEDADGEARRSSHCCGCVC